MIDGVVVVDKPQGPTSHDIVAAARRALAEKRIGHTGTLDPMATGVLPLACGRATRLVRFLTASDKEYDASIRLGLTTDTYDVTGRELARSDQRPTQDALLRALEGLTGEYLQAPPPYSAKKIGGQRAYDLARQARRSAERAEAARRATGAEVAEHAESAAAAVQPAPVRVAAHRVELVAFTGDAVSVRITCSAGFYVRSLAHDLGARLGMGGCLESLRRTRSGDFTLDQAISIDLLAGDRTAVAARVLPMSALLPGLPALTLTDEGAVWVAHGRLIGPPEIAAGWPRAAARAIQGAGRPADTSTRPEAMWVRLFRADGVLLALAEPGERPGSLHPSVVLI